MKNTVLFILLFCLSSTCLFAQPTADFTANITEGCAPLEVTFTDSSIGSGLTYLWDFGDGNTSTEMNPTLIYVVEAEYTVCLTVTDDQGLTDDTCMTNLITVFPEDESYIGYALCPGGSIVIGGVLFDVTNPNGQVVLTNTAGCDSTIVVDLTFFPTSTNTIDETLCDGEFVNVNGTVYDVNNPTGIEIISNADVNGCDSVVSVYLDFIPAGEIGIVGTTSSVDCATGTGGSICITNVYCGVEPYTYDWGLPGETASCINDLAPGIYQLTITDAVGTTEIEQFLVDDAPVISLIPVITNVTCNGEADACVSLTDVTGGCEPYTYLWDNSNTSATNCNIAAGNTSVTITDCTLCTAEFTFTITEPEPLNIAATTVTCPTTGNDDGSIAITVTGGGGAYTYDWSNGANTAAIAGLSADVYTVTVTDDNGCTEETSFELGNDLSVSVLAVTNPSCYGSNDGVVCLDVSCGTPPYLYEWSGASTPSPGCLGDFVAGTHEITITDANSNSVVETITLVGPAPIDIVFATDSTACEGDEVDFLVALPTGPGYSYLWTGPGGFTSTDIGFTLTMDISTEGCYTVEVTDASGCQSTETHCVDVTTFSDVINAPIFDAYICNGGAHEFDVDASTAIGISWTPSIGLSCDDCFDPIASPTATTVYTVEIVAANSCVITREVTVFVEEQPIIDVVVPLTVCAGESLNACLAFSGGTPIAWEWTTPLGIITDECLDIPALSSANEGLYEVTVTFAGGCTASTDFNLDVATVTYAISDSVEICRGNSTTLDVSDTDIASVEWSPATDLSCTQCLDTEAAPLETITYTAVIVGDNGCVATDMVTVTVDQNCVWPGDTDTNKVVNNFDLLNIGLAYDSVGPVRPNANLMWVGQPAPDWTQAAPNGSNYKHIDTDGNGLIDANDTLAVSQNWGEMHNLTGDHDSQLIPTYPPSNGGVATIPFYVQPDTLIEGQMISLPVILGESGNPAEDVYGIAFTLEYDTAVVVPGSVYMGFDQSWLGDNDADLISIHRDFFADNKVDIGMTRIDGIPMTDFGTLANLFITVEDDLLFAPGGNSSGFTPTQNDAVFNITNVLVINHLGEEIEVIPTQTTADVVATATSTHNPGLATNISIFPNPATDLLWVKTKDIKLNKIEVLNVSGQMLSTIIAPEAQQKIDLNQFGMGTYFVKVHAEEGVYVERIVLMK